MSKKIGDICFKTGSYEKDGETKNRYLKGGVLFQGDDGSFYGVIEAVPVGIEGRFSVFAPRQDNRMPDPRDAAQPSGDIPF